MGPCEPFVLLGSTPDSGPRGPAPATVDLPQFEVRPEHDPLRPGVDGRRQQFGEGQLEVLGCDLVHVLADGTGEHACGERERDRRGRTARGRP